MFSHHLQKFTRFPRLGLVMLAAALVVVCQLLAVVMVGGNPVPKASVRDLHQEALSACIQRSSMVSRHGCIRQSQLESADRELAAASLPDESGSINRLVAVDEDVSTDRADRLRVAAAR